MPGRQLPGAARPPWQSHDAVLDDEVREGGERVQLAVRPPLGRSVAAPRGWSLAASRAVPKEALALSFFF